MNSKLDYPAKRKVQFWIHLTHSEIVPEWSHENRKLIQSNFWTGYIWNCSHVNKSSKWNYYFHVLCFSPCSITFPLVLALKV